MRLLDDVPDIDVVATAADGEEAVGRTEEHRPDVVLMDLRMPRLDGAEAARRICATNPETHVVILTSFSERDEILAALEAGAIGYLLKDAEPDEIVRGVRAAARTPRTISSGSASLSR